MALCLLPLVSLRDSPEDNLAPERPGVSEDGQIYKPVEAAFTECC